MSGSCNSLLVTASRRGRRGLASVTRDVFRCVKNSGCELFSLSLRGFVLWPAFRVLALDPNFHPEIQSALMETICEPTSAASCSTPSRRWWYTHPSCSARGPADIHHTHDLSGSLPRSPASLQPPCGLRTLLWWPTSPLRRCRERDLGFHNYFCPSGPLGTQTQVIGCVQWVGDHCPPLLSSRRLL